MFTGIIESIGKVIDLREDRTNIHFKLTCDFLNELKVDQSISHNGVCLTVTLIDDEGYEVTAVEETLEKSNLKNLRTGDLVNLERCMLASGRFDGHIVQGHVDQTAVCRKITDQSGSWLFEFEIEGATEHLIVEKGSICVNGVSLTCFNIRENKFTVTIIPFTIDHTNFQQLNVGDQVNIEFDVVGKYIKKLVG